MSSSHTPKPSSSLPNARHTAPWWLPFTVLAWRPLNWLLLLIAIGCFAIGQWQTGSRFRPIIPEMRPWTQEILNQASAWQPQPSTATEELEAGQRPWDWTDFDTSVSGVVLYGGPSIPWEKFQQMPNLKYLKLGDFRRKAGFRGSKLAAAMGADVDPKDPQLDDLFMGHQLRNLTKLPQLHGIALPKGVYRPEVTEAWRALTELRWLDARKATFTEGAVSLPAWPKLHTLEFQAEDLSPQLVASLDRYPKLHTLVLHDDVSGRRSNVTGTLPRVALTPEQQAGLQQLKEVPQLRRIYVPGREYSDFELTAQQTLPHVSVRPLSTDDSQPQLVLFNLAGGCLLALVGAMSTYGHFTRPESKLIPFSQAPNIQFTQYWLLACCLITLGLIAARGIDVAAAFGLSLVVIAIVASQLQLQAGVLRFVWIVLCFGQISAQIAIVRMYLRWLFVGDLPWVSLALSVTGTVILVRWFAVLIHQCRENAESGVPGPLLTLQDFGLASQAVAGKKLNADKAQKFRRYQVRSDNWIARVTASFHGQRPGARRQLLRLPNAPGVRFVAGTFVAGFALFPPIAHWYGSFHVGISVLVLAYLSLITTSMAIGPWLTRRSQLSYEICRPVRRVDYLRDTFLAIGQDMCWAPLTLTVMLSAWMFAILPVPLALQNSLACLALTTAVLMFVFGAAMWSITSYREWVIVLTSILGLIVLVGCVVLYAWISGQDGLNKIREQLDAQGIVAVVGLLAVLDTWLIWSAWRAWSGLEFARLQKA